jgi:hypothetical protein
MRNPLAWAFGPAALPPEHDSKCTVVGSTLGCWAISDEQPRMIDDARVVVGIPKHPASQAPACAPAAGRRVPWVPRTGHADVEDGEARQQRAGGQ